MECRKKKGIVIVGHPRSGTTLLRRLLNGHSKIASPPETHLLSACGRFLDSERTASGVDIGALSGLYFAGVSDEQVIEKLRQFAFSFLEDYAAREDKERWAEKTAFNAFHIKNIEKLCGDYVFYVGIVRQPLDVALSSVKFCESMGFYPKDMHRYISEHSNPIEAFAHSWTDVSQSLIELNESQNGNCKIFKYEDLATRPEETLREILSFVGENFEETMLKKGLSLDQNIGFGDHKSYQTRHIHDQSIGRSQYLPEFQVQTLAPLLNPMLDYFGYPALEQKRIISVAGARLQYSQALQIVADSSLKYTSDNTPNQVIQQFMNQVTERADHTAIVFEGESVSYKELGRRVSALSALLHSRGVGANKIVAVCMERSINLVTALLAVMHAGGTYVPLDPDHPQSRISNILDDVDPHFLLTDTYSKKALKSFASEKLYVLDNDLWSANHDTSIKPYEIGDLAYIIFTSGSSGRPKGVEVYNQGLNTFLSAMAEEPGLSKKDRLLSVTTVSFDIAALEIFLPLVVGATLYIASKEDTMNGLALQKLMEEQSISCFQATPATFYILLNNQWEGHPSLKLLCGGEAMPPELAEKLLNRCESLWNMYGPTETTIWSTIKKVESVQSLIPIGKAICGTRTYVLNEEGAQVPIGMPGELYIAGEGVAKGYFAREDLTSERFLPEINSTNTGARMYRTGDLVKTLDNGDLVYLGRLDRQVKIRGYRIELGEIETAIKKRFNVKQCVVDVYQPSGTSKSLVAYIVPVDKASQDDIITIRTYLKPHVPEYMIPSFLVYLDELPLTPNNKVDRNALPAPIMDKEFSLEQKGAWTNEVEAKTEKFELNTYQGKINEIIQSWKQIFGSRHIRPSDSFVSLGGDSLSFVQATIELENILGLIPDGWETKSIKELSNVKQEENTILDIDTTIFSDIDTTIFIRSVSIISVLFLHAFPNWGLLGSTSGLFMVSGLLFAKFQFKLISRQNNVLPIFKSALRILLPATLIMGTFLYIKGDMRLDLLLLYSNFGPKTSSYWFIQVLMQIFLFLAVIFSIKPVIKYADKNPYKFGLLLFSTSVALMLITPFLPIVNFSPHSQPQQHFWQFMMGWCIYLADTKMKRINLIYILAFVAISQFIIFLGDKDNLTLTYPAMTIVFGALMLFHKKLLVFKKLKPLLYGLAASSLYIYVISIPLNLFTYLYFSHTPVLAGFIGIFFSLLSGYVVWLVSEIITNKIKNSLLSRKSQGVFLDKS